MISVRDVVKKAGGRQRLAHHLNISYTSVYKWKKIPAERVIAIEELTGIPREDIRPDIYPREARRRA